MSIPAFAWALAEGYRLRLPTSERMVLIYLANMANGSQECWPGQETIVAWTGLSERQVRISLHALERLGLVSSERRGKSRLYRINRQSNGKDHATPAHTAGNNLSTPAHTAGETPAHYAGKSQKHRHIVPKTPAHCAETPAHTAGNPSKTLLGTHSAPKGADDASLRAASSDGPREELFGEGIAIAKRVLGVMDSGARAFVGRLLKVAKDDAVFVLAKLRECERERPLDPGGWLVAAVVPFRNAGVALIAEERKARDGLAALERLLAWEAQGHA
jgi:DNA-binding transcriptional ArsR family regulator